MFLFFDDRPETRGTSAVCPGEGEWLGIRFKLGTFMPQLPIENILDRQDVTLPQATKRTFWLDGSAWEYPTFENAEALSEESPVPTVCRESAWARVTDRIALPLPGYGTSDRASLSIDLRRQHSR